MWRRARRVHTIGINRATGVFSSKGPSQSCFRHLQDGDTIDFDLSIFVYEFASALRCTLQYAVRGIEGKDHPPALPVFQEEIVFQE